MDFQKALFFTLIAAGIIYVVGTALGKAILAHFAPLTNFLNIVALA